MKYIISRYNHDMAPILKYAKEDFVLYDRSEEKINDYRMIPVPNIGSDIFDKFTYIIDNYDNLPEIAVYTKANLFQYITQEEFETALKKAEKEKVLVPLLTQNHKTYMPICFYSDDGMYNELNNRWYLAQHGCKHLGRPDELMSILGMKDKEYLKFAPGSNYIVPRANILQYPKEFYITLRKFLDWDVYPGEAQIMERGLFYLWSMT